MNKTICAISGLIETKKAEVVDIVENILIFKIPTNSKKNSQHSEYEYYIQLMNHLFFVCYNEIQTVDLINRMLSENDLSTEEKQKEYLQMSLDKLIKSGQINKGLLKLLEQEHRISEIEEVRLRFQKEKEERTRQYKEREEQRRLASLEVLQKQKEKFLAGEFIEQEYIIKLLKDVNLWDSIPIKTKGWFNNKLVRGSLTQYAFNGRSQSSNYFSIIGQLKQELSK